MSIFVNFKKKILKKKLYEYTMMYKDALSKSEILKNKADEYLKLASHLDPKTSWFNIEELQQKSYKCKIDSEHYKNVSEMYLDMKLDVEDELSNLSYRKV